MNTSERDLLRVLRDVDLVLPLAVNTFVANAVMVHYIKLSTWLRYLMNVRQGGLLLGGFAPDDHFAKVCLRGFWEAFEKERPGHAVYDLHRGRLDKVIPFALHLDEGRGLRKTGVLVVQAQTLFGAETRPNFEQELNFRWADGLSHAEIMDIMLRNQFHNARGSTYKTRMLYTILPKASYTKRNKNVYDVMLDKIREEATSLLEDGFTLQDGSRYFACLVAVKADAPAMAKAGNLDRNFQNLGNPLCPECLAGAPGVPFEDCRPDPTYEATIFTQRPWTTPSPLSLIPGDPNAPEALYLRDPFHVYKQALGGYYTASSIVLIAALGYWDTNRNNFDDVMERAYEDFAHYVRHDFRGGVPHLKHFTRTNLHYPRTSSFPYMRPKGSDVMLLTRWLGFLMLHGPLLGGARSSGNMIDNPLHASHAGFFRNISAASKAAAMFFSGHTQPGPLAHERLREASERCSTSVCRSLFSIGNAVPHRRKGPILLGPIFPLLAPFLCRC